MEEQYLSDATLLACVKASVEAGGVFRFYPRGVSMLPTIREGRDAVLLVAPTDYKVGDALLYRRANGKAVLHRLLAIRKDGLVFSGDNQGYKETGLSPDAVYAKLSAVIYDDKDPALRRVEAADSREHLAAVRRVRRRYPIRRARYLLSRVKAKIKVLLRK